MYGTSGANHSVVKGLATFMQSDLTNRIDNIFPLSPSKLNSRYVYMIIRREI